MSLFDQLQGGPRAPQINPQQMLAQLRANPAAVLQQVPQANLQQMLAQLRANPAEVLQQCGLNIPQGMNDPQAILQHLMQTGRSQMRGYSRSCR